MTQSIALITCAGANFASVRFALERLGVAVTETADPDVVVRADKAILPGVGAAAAGMQALRDHNLCEVLRTSTKPLLGICLGMQLFYEHSAEGGTSCLGRLPGAVERFAAVPGQRVPHMGWNSLRIADQGNPLLRGVNDGDHAYFVHSYYAPAKGAAAVTDYGAIFAAVVQQDNLFACQFHPERSAAVGRTMLENFVKL